MACSPELKQALKELKQYPRETAEDVVWRLIRTAKKEV
jgi:hypothetical protein